MLNDNKDDDDDDDDDCDSNESFVCLVYIVKIGCMNDLCKIVWCQYKDSSLHKKKVETLCLVFWNEKMNATEIRGRGKKK
jgi:hypothetical protein